MTKEDFIKNTGVLFDVDCGFNPVLAAFSGIVERKFSPDAKEMFLGHLWEKVGEPIPGDFDFESPPAIIAMMRAQRNSSSMQEQMAKFPVYFAQEIMKAKAIK